MRSIGSRAALAAAALGAAATVIATAAPASAQANGGKFTRVYSLANGPCAAVVDSSVTGNAYPSSAAFTVSTTMYGVGSCSLDVTLNWRHVETGQTGTVTRHANGPGYWGTDGRGSIFSPGVYGDFVGTVTVGAAHIPEPGEVRFSVQQYRG
ncbi:hypothetical protein DFR68_106219 [Nocardia mexicana]|uniref:Uncharacterized protein n=2 Tax=Nocardia mexicana TaxID=279262 RepID=A0A370H3L3_9NOCA|nr:hypothetical protein DFR68_106219 [Nocardia mexicana]